MQTTAVPTFPNFDAHFAEKSSAKCPMLLAKWDSAKRDSAKRAYTASGNKLDSPSSNLN